MVKFQDLLKEKIKVENYSEIASMMGYRSSKEMIFCASQLDQIVSNLDHWMSQPLFDLRNSKRHFLLSLTATLRISNKTLIDFFTEREEMGIHCH